MGVQELREVLSGDVQVRQEIVGVPGTEPGNDGVVVVGDGGDEGALTGETAVGLEVDGGKTSRKGKRFGLVMVERARYDRSRIFP